MRADLILTNAKVYTVDPARSVAEAVAVSGGRIVAVGAAAEVEDLRGPDTQVLDLDGRLVLPGFIDAHMHPLGGVETACGVPLAGASSPAACLDAVARFAADHPKTPVVFGGGWTTTMIADSALLATDLDAVVPDRPVWLADDSYHLAWVNSAALRAAGFTAETPDPANGVIDRLPGGEPSGLLREGPVWTLKMALPPLPADDIADGLARFQREIGARYGITTVHDAGANLGQPPVEPYLRLQDEGRLSLRTYLSRWFYEDAPFADQLAEALADRERLTGPWVRMRTAKLFADGVLEAHTGWLKEPYADRPDSRGATMSPPDEFTAMAVSAARAGFQIHIHAIGDAALAMSLDAIEAAWRAGEGAFGPGARPLITHLQLVDPADLPRMADLGVIAVPQPYWFYYEPGLDDLMITLLGEERADHQYPMRSYWDQGILVASASDYPVGPPCDPLLAIQRGVLRRAPKLAPGAPPMWPEEAVSVERMVESFTINGGYGRTSSKRRRARSNPARRPT